MPANKSLWNWFTQENLQAKDMPAKEGRFASLQSLHADMDRFFENIYRRMPFASHAQLETGAGKENMPAEETLLPKLDIVGDEKQYVISLEVPGVSDKDLKVELQDDLLIIHGEKKFEHEEEKDGIYHMERSYGSFQRVLTLPADALSGEIKAVSKAGVLQITVPRQKLAPKEGKTIEIAVS